MLTVMESAVFGHARVRERHKAHSMLACSDITVLVGTWASAAANQSIESSAARGRAAGRAVQPCR